MFYKLFKLFKLWKTKLPTPNSENGMNEKCRRQYFKAVEFFGLPARLLCESKQAYTTNHPNHVVVFNGNLCTEDGKIWHGDVDVTMDSSKIDSLAQEIGKTVYLLKEMDARFENEQQPLLDKAVYVSRETTND